MDLEFMKRNFPNYTDAMWAGNEPDRKEPRASGDPADHWYSQWGSGVTLAGKVLQADFCLGNNVSLWVNQESMVIRRHLADGWVRVFDVNPPFSHGRKTQQMEPEEAERYLSKKFPNNKLWGMVQARAWELYRSK